VNGEIFYDIDLINILMPFNGTNKNSVVIMDNCSIHHMKKVVDAIEETGAILHFLPPTQQISIPLRMKAVMKSNVDKIVYAAFSSVSSNDCK